MNDPVGLAAQIDDDGVAFAGLPEDHALQGQLVDALDGQAGFVVAPLDGVGAAGLRDLGQDVLNASSVDTVIVRSPESAAVVSNELSRAAIESAQGAIFAEPDYVVGTHRFLNEVSGFDMPWALLTAVVVVAIVIAVAWTVRSVKA